MLRSSPSALTILRPGPTWPENAPERSKSQTHYGEWDPIARKTSGRIVIHGRALLEFQITGFSNIVMIYWNLLEFTGTLLEFDWTSTGIYWKSLEILRKSLEILGDRWKSLEIDGKV